MSCVRVVCCVRVPATAVCGVDDVYTRASSSFSLLQLYWFCRVVCVVCRLCRVCRVCRVCLVSACVCALRRVPWQTTGA
jgi:hypothetical protein